jgi:hypothetical protein
MGEEYTQTVFVAGRKEAYVLAAEMQQWAKDNAPWMDRTGDARAGLRGEVDEEVGAIGVIILTHDPLLDYPIWLEIAHQGRFAIIAPAIDYWGPIFFKRMKRLMNLGQVALD